MQERDAGGDDRKDLAQMRARAIEKPFSNDSMQDREREPAVAGIAVVRVVIHDHAAVRMPLLVSDRLGEIQHHVVDIDEIRALLLEYR